MNCAWLFLSTLLCFTELEYGEVNGLTFDDLDFARSTIESVAKSITSKPAFMTSPIYKSLTKFGSVFKSSSSDRITPEEMERYSKIPTIMNKPRNLNKFNEAMGQVERAMVQAELSRRTANLTDLRNDIMNAVAGGNVRFARRALGIALYTASQESKPKRSTGNSTKQFLSDIKKDLGAEKFSDFLALDGDVTLIFVLDVTGSMKDEIKSCKEMIKKISKYPRNEPVNFLLTTFSDPIDLGISTLFKEDQRNQLVTHVDKLQATGGGDCPEFSFDGMINALSEDPDWGSPLYVFTDAPPKDADEESKESLMALADDLGVTVNFFTGKTVCGSEIQQQPYKDLVEAYSGQYMRLDSLELIKMAKVTDNSLDGCTAVASGKKNTARRRRRATTNIGIPVDDTVDKLIVTVTTESSPHSVQLYTPNGHVQTVGRTVLSRVIIFSVNKPLKGLWKLMIPSSFGKYEYLAKVSSPENIEFEHYFSKNERAKLISLRNPLAGQSSQVSLTVSGAKNIQISSLSVDLIDISGKTLIGNKKLISEGKSGVRFSFNLVPPNKLFKLMLKGKTKAGKTFQRISRHVDSSKPLVVKEYYTYRHYTIPLKGQTTVLFYLFNGLSAEKAYDVSFKIKKSYTASLYGSQARVSRMKVRGGRKKYLRVTVRYNGGTPGKVGDTLNVIIIVKGRDKSFITTEVVPLMII